MDELERGEGGGVTACHPFIRFVFIMPCSEGDSGQLEGDPGSGMVSVCFVSFASILSI